MLCNQTLEDASDLVFGALMPRCYCVQRMYGTDHMEFSSYIGTLVCGLADKLLFMKSLTIVRLEALS